MDGAEVTMRLARTGVSVRATQLPDGGLAVKNRTYEPCFSKTFPAFLAATFSLR